MILLRGRKQFILTCKDAFKDTVKFNKFCTYLDCKGCTLWPYLYGTEGGERLDNLNYDFVIIGGGVYVLLLKEETVLTE